MTEEKFRQVVAEFQDYYVEIPGLENYGQLIMMGTGGSPVITTRDRFLNFQEAVAILDKNEGAIFVGPDIVGTYLDITLSQETDIWEAA